MKLLLVTLSIITLIRTNETLDTAEYTDNSVKKSCNNRRGKCVFVFFCKDMGFKTSTQECEKDVEVCCDLANITATLELINLDSIPKTCGRRNPKGVGFKMLESNISTAYYGEFPWMVGILERQKNNVEIIDVLRCGGSLITPNVVLTAAHCVDGKIPSTLKIRIGELNSQSTNEIFSHFDYQVIDVIFHENFSRKNMKIRNDIALLFLNDTVKIAENINTICLPPQNQTFDSKRCFVTGWGKDVFGRKGKYQATLKKIKVSIIPFKFCQNKLKNTFLRNEFILHESFMCAGGDGERDVCKGDEGGPLVCEINEKPGFYYQAGIFSWGIECGKNDVPSVYTDVAKFRAWIDQKITFKNLPIEKYIIDF